MNDQTSTAGTLVRTTRGHHRKIAQANWGLTDAQMQGMHVHHRVPRSLGGLNDPSNLYVCSPWFHAHVWHGEDSYHPMIVWATKAGAKGGKKGGAAGRGRPKPPRPEEVKEKIRISNRPGVSRPNDNGPAIRAALAARTPEQKAQESENKRQGHLGKPLSKAHRDSIGAAQKGRVHPQTTCPHCGMTGACHTMARWHFNNCKHKP